MFHQQLTARNAYLTEMLKQAGLDSQARDVADRIQAVLTDEIHHRMKNMLTVVTALVRQTMRASPAWPTPKPRSASGWSPWPRRTICC